MMIIVLQPSHVALLHETHWIILVTWVWCRPPQRPCRVPGASEWIPRTSKTQHWKHGDRPRNILSMNVRDGLVPLCWLSMFRQGHRTLGPVGKLGESESTPRTSETPSYGFLCTEFPRPVLSFSVFQHGPSHVSRFYAMRGATRSESVLVSPTAPL